MGKREQNSIDKHNKISEVFKKHNCELFSTKYSGERKKMKFRCSCGRVSYISLRTFLYSYKCRYCTKQKIGDQFRLSHSDVSDFFKQNGCVLLSDVYNTCHDLLVFKCSCGRIGKKSFVLFKISPKCKKCISEESTKRQTFSYEYVSNFFEDNGCKLLSEIYKNSWTPVKYVCKCGNISSVAFCDFIRGNRCRGCYIEKISGSGNPFWQPDRDKLKENKKFRFMIRNILASCLRTIGVRKNNKTEKLLGYTYLDLKNHIQNFTTWKDLSDKKWHVDHIFPIKAFLDNNIKDIKLINGLDNLRPLLGIENLKKNDKYDKKEFAEWLKNRHNITI